MIATPAPRPSRWWRPLAAAAAVLLAGSALSALPSAPAHAADDFVYPLDESKRLPNGTLTVTPDIPGFGSTPEELNDTNTYVSMKFKLNGPQPAEEPFYKVGEQRRWAAWTVNSEGVFLDAQYFMDGLTGADPTEGTMHVGVQALNEYDVVLEPGTYEYIYVLGYVPRTATGESPMPPLTSFSDYRYAEIGLRVHVQPHPDDPDIPYGTWEWVPASEIHDGGGSPSKTATSTTVSYSNLTATTAKVTATVSPSAATGNVIFKNGSVIVGTGTLNNGVATVPVAGLAPNSSVTITTEYAGDAKHEASAGTVSFTTQEAADGSNTGIGVTVPPAESDDPTGLRIATKPTAVMLEGGARIVGSVWTAENDLGAVTVNDDRRNAGAQGWTLNAQAGGFTGSGTAQGQLIPATALTWTATATGAGKLGPTGVTLDQPRAIATGTASNERNQATTINGHLSLAVPATQTAGGYSSTLTLTLI